MHFTSPPSVLSNHPPSTDHPDNIW